MEDLPLISVIVPVYNVELYIRKCIESILSQTYRNLEIILVDDGSKDRCGEICDEYALKDNRIRVIHKENGGLSDARNVGIDASRGEYIGFVDSDDWIVPDMYEYLYRGLIENNADISVCEYYNVWRSKAQATYRPSTRIFSGSSCLWALLRLKVGNYAWNKLYKRNLWEDGIRYPVGKLYEDVRTTYRIFQKVSVVAALPEAKYFYRRHVEGITSTKTVSSQGQCVESRMTRYDKLIQDWPDEKSFLIKEIYEYLIQLREVVCGSDRKEFDNERELMGVITSFVECHFSDFCNRYSWGKAGRYALSCMANNSYESWRRSAFVDGMIKNKTTILESKTIKKIKNFSINKEKNTIIDHYFATYRSASIDAGSAFVESRGGEDLAGNMFAIAEVLCSRGMRVFLCVKAEMRDKVCAIVGSGSFPGLHIVEKYSADYYKTFSTAKYIFNDMVFNDLLLKNSGQVWVNTWHGTPLKSLEFDVRNQRHVMGGGTRGYLEYDYLAVPSTYLAQKLLESSDVDQLYSGQILCSGYPRNSIFFDTAERDRTRNRLAVEDKEIFVYMPTWRGTAVNHQGTSGLYTTQAILDFFENKLSDNQVLFVKLHNYAVDQISFVGYQKVRPFPVDIDSYNVLNASDCLITDYSSVFFDYANSGHKIVLFTYDKEEYLRDRGFYLDLDEIPYPKVNTYAELESELNLTKRYDDSKFRSTYCTFDCPDAVDRLLSVVIDGKKACETIKQSNNGKQNILIYDAQYYLRDALPEQAEDYLSNLDVTEANYYYGIRQWVLKRTPKYLANLPEGIRLYPLCRVPELTSEEKRTCKGRKHTLPDSLIQREIDREFYGNPFDKIYVINENKYDPFVPILKRNPKYCPIE